VSLVSKRIASHVPGLGPTADKNAVTPKVLRLIQNEEVYILRDVGVDNVLFK
jgi:hypothetical protein